ncbi:Zn2/Cys6 DNA-binding protein [Glarea lozoyensis ATCC 20868]|uniref:Zn2/Cys6 DNA-binding protein n=1 Tax=Glarea lozoyensis (strain ATCC 20868 / MF5171) TaxID=1116229 RepID=S3DFF0_GLAL2|nr:Zn2/Cys6 DNA-binding protein [Glarea lozoyensis ATCC 20868]EPE25363.1 Zn2/Cys6 DNA-binding protein [Glarea lozoyensis ATCC 20868]
MSTPSAMKKSRKPKTNCQRTFTACWTCRRRNVRCDNAVPHCSQCERMRVPCEGYEIRLVWVDTATGAYVPQQRRAYPCELTWKGYPDWTLKQVGHLIDDCELRECRCKIQHKLNPFYTFLQNEGAEVDSDNGTRLSELPSGDQLYEESARDSCGSPTSEVNCLISERDAAVSVVHSVATSPIDRNSLLSGKYETTLDNGDIERNPCSRETALSVSISRNPSQSFTPHGFEEENFLFSHYVSQLPGKMMPIDDGRNPWRSTYPSIAVLGAQTSSTEALYYAILAQSAYSISNLKGPKRGKNEKAIAMRFSGKAIQELRRSLESPEKEYSSVLAALLSIMLAEHVFNHNSHGWRRHIRGAVGFVSQYVTQKPWMLSHDAWIITQNFVLAIVLSQTVCSGTINSPDYIKDIDGMVDDVISQPSFGYTMGGNTRLLGMIYQARQIDVQLANMGYKPGIQGMKEDILVQVEEMFSQLEKPLDDDVELYMEQQASNSARTRQLVEVHLNLFHGGVMIYFLCTVLQNPPSTVARQVSEVLNNTMTFVDTHSKYVSVWPVFMAMVEAYTLESLELANRYLASSNEVSGNRKDIDRVVRQVWADREELASARQCNLGEIFVDWRDVMKKLNLDILLL